MRDIVLDGESLKIRDVVETGLGKTIVSLSNKAREKMENSRLGINRILKSGETTYGVNTGFGALSSVSIDSDKLEALQVNLIRSHACGLQKILHSRRYFTIYAICQLTFCI